MNGKAAKAERAERKERAEEVVAMAVPIRGVLEYARGLELRIEALEKRDRRQREVTASFMGRLKWLIYGWQCWVFDWIP